MFSDPFIAIPKEIAALIVSFLSPLHVVDYTTNGKRHRNSQAIVLLGTSPVMRSITLEMPFWDEPEFDLESLIVNGCSKSCRICRVLCTDEQIRKRLERKVEWTFSTDDCLSEVAA